MLTSICIYRQQITYADVCVQCTVHQSDDTRAKAIRLVRIFGIFNYNTSKELFRFGTYLEPIDLKHDDDDMQFVTLHGSYSLSWLNFFLVHPSVDEF